MANPHPPNSGPPDDGAIPRRRPRIGRVFAGTAVALVVVAAIVAGALYGPGIATQIFEALFPTSSGSVVPLSQPSGPPPGARAVGSASYSIPSDALYVSPSGNDQAQGTKAHPLLTVQQAVSLAHSGQTIVLRGGTYNQRVTVLPGKPVTIEPYPHEAVWFDGSTIVSHWQQDGTAWVSDGWTAHFDNSPSYTQGAAPSSNPKFDFVGSQNPLAADPDQVWIDGTALRQVATPNEVTPGTFAVDYGTSQLFVGSNPNGNVVRASNKSKAFSLQASGTVLRGIGVERYATSLPQFGAITVEATHVTVEDLTVVDNATTGIFVAAADCIVRDTTLDDNGMIGLSANYADRLTVSRVIADGNNVQLFNQAPVAGGFKITGSRGIVVSNSQFDSNLGTGLWFDESDYDATVTSDSMSGNSSHGLTMEISARFVVANDVILNNHGNGINLNDTDDVQVWHNTLANNDIDIRVVQDSRRATDASIPGHNPHRPANDPTMPWVISRITVSDNVLSGSTGTAVASVADLSGEYTAAQLGVTLNGNAYQRANATTPQSLVAWGESGGGTGSFPTLKSFAKATGQEKLGVELPFSAAANRDWLGSAEIGSAAAAGKPRLPDAIRALLGWNSAVEPLGAIQSDS